MLETRLPRSIQLMSRKPQISASGKGQIDQNQSWPLLRPSDSLSPDVMRIHEDPVSNAKKRAKVVAKSHRPEVETTILSPKSANSRTLPRSPLKSEKPVAPPSMSPLKSTTLAAEKSKTARSKAAKSKATGRLVKTQKTGGTNTDMLDTLRNVSTTSSSSAFSVGTTIVSDIQKKQAVPRRKAQSKPSTKKPATTEISVVPKRTLRQR